MTRAEAMSILRAIRTIGSNPENGLSLAKGIADQAQPDAPNDSLDFEQRYFAFDTKASSKLINNGRRNMKPVRGPQKFVNLSPLWPKLRRTLWPERRWYVEPRPGIRRSRSNTVRAHRPDEAQRLFKVICVELIRSEDAQRSRSRHTRRKVVVLMLPSAAGERRDVNCSIRYNSKLRRRNARRSAVTILVFCWACAVVDNASILHEDFTGVILGVNVVESVRYAIRMTPEKFSFRRRRRHEHDNFPRRCRERLRWASSDRNKAQRI